MSKYTGTKTEANPAGGICRRVSGKKQVYILRIGCPQKEGEQIAAIFQATAGQREGARQTLVQGAGGLAIPL